MSTAPRIRTAHLTDAASVAYIVATAFHGLDVSGWLIPDPVVRADRFPDYVRIMTDHAFAHGTVEITADLNAAAVWLSAPFPDPIDYQTRLARACGPWTPRFQLLDAAMDHAHPRDLGEHDYLVFLAVIPHHQGHGLGTALLEHHHTDLDRHHRPAYLEASNTTSRRLYARRGYSDCAPPLDLPYPGEAMFPMCRPPAPPSHGDHQP